MKTQVIVRNCSQLGKFLLLGVLVLSALACSNDDDFQVEPWERSASATDSDSGSASDIDMPQDASNLIVNGGVEDGVPPWRYQGNEVIVSRSNAQSHTGEYSLLVEGRSVTWHGAAVDLPKNLTVGKTYNASVWVRLADGEDDTVVAMTLNRKDDTEGQGPDGNFTQIASATATDDKWVELSGTFVYAAEGKVRELYLYIEAEQITASYYVDDLVLAARTE